MPQIVEAAFEAHTIRDLSEGLGQGARVNWLSLNVGKHEII